VEIRVKKEKNKVTLIFDSITEASQFYREAIMQYSNDCWSTTEIVQRYDIPFITVDSWVKRGLLTNVGVGRLRRFKKTQVKWVMRQENIQKLDQINYAKA